MLLTLFWNILLRKYLGHGTIPFTHASRSERECSTGVAILPGSSCEGRDGQLHGKRLLSICPCPHHVGGGCPCPRCAHLIIQQWIWRMAWASYFSSAIILNTCDAVKVATNSEFISFPLESGLALKLFV